jgi:hypothetical protein
VGFSIGDANNRNDNSSKEIDWEEFFAKFDENGPFPRLSKDTRRRSARQLQ